VRIGIFRRMKNWAQAVRRDVHAIYLAARDPRVPWHAKALALCVAGYALSPIDLIPDFIPMVGWLDDLIIVPLGISLAVRMIPGEIMEEHRAVAEAAQRRPVSWLAAGLIVTGWILFAFAAGWWAYVHFGSESL
jgi:uncharacterized membrane protein YkvA (DUF1232 family)